TDGKKNRFVLPARFFDRFAAPRMPVNGVMGMLQEIRGGGINEMVGKAVLCLLGWGCVGQSSVSKRHNLVLATTFEGESAMMRPDRMQGLRKSQRRHAVRIIW